MSTTKQYIAILGLDEKKQPRADKIDLVDAEVVRKATALMDLATASTKTD